uniref:Uncharacterized protein n=1 Tax=viral metagenome TaxID=1070528 RepID=A0A6C0KWA6_9ZZZZ
MNKEEIINTLFIRLGKSKSNRNKLKIIGEIVELSKKGYKRQIVKNLQNPKYNALFRKSLDKSYYINGGGIDDGNNNSDDDDDNNITDQDILYFIKDDLKTQAESNNSIRDIIIQLQKLQKKINNDTTDYLEKKILTITRNKLIKLFNEYNGDWEDFNYTGKYDEIYMAALKKEELSGSRLDPCNFGRITQVEGTCWFTAILNMFLLSDTLKAILSLSLTNQFNLDKDRNVKSNTKLKNFLSKMKKLYETTCYRDAQTPYNLRLIVDMLLYLYYILYLGGKTIKYINRDISSLAINHAFGKEFPIPEYFKLKPEGHDYLWNINNETETDLIANIILLLINFCGGKTYSNMILTVGYSDKIQSIPGYIPIACIIGIRNNQLKLGHSICGFICNNKQYIFDSATHINRHINSNYRENIDNFRIMEHDWLEFNEINGYVFGIKGYVLTYDTTIYLKIDDGKFHDFSPNSELIEHIERKQSEIIEHIQREKAKIAKNQRNARLEKRLAEMRMTKF